MRENDYSPDGTLKIKSDKVSPKYIGGGTVINPVKHNQVVSPKEPIWTIRPGGYKIGDGDLCHNLRPGADDHKKYQSLENKGTVAVYPRSHK